MGTEMLRRKLRALTSIALSFMLLGAAVTQSIANAATTVAQTSDGRQLPSGIGTSWNCDTNRCKYAIHGTVRAAPNSTVKIRITDHLNRTIVTYTNGTGEYQLLHLAPGRYLVRPVMSDMTFNPETASVTIIKVDVAVAVFEQVSFKDSLTPEELPPEGETAGPVNYPETTILPNGQSVSAFAQTLGIDLNSVNSGHPLVTPLDETQIQMAMLASAEGFACPIGSACQNFPVGPLGKKLEPMQKRFAYVWGDKTPSSRTGPNPAAQSMCKDLLFGMDCQGLVINIASAASITAPGGTSAQSDPDNWSNLPPNVSLIETVDGSIQSGDLVFWSGHDGIATSSGDFISSTGGPTSSCEANLRRGPVEYSFTTFGRGSPTTVLRFVSESEVTVTADPTSLPSTGGMVTLTAAVTALASLSSGASPTGTVSFTDQDDAELCTDVPLQSGGTAICSTPISQTPNTITAQYSGDNNDLASSATVSVGSSGPQTYVGNFTLTGTEGVPGGSNCIWTDTIVGLITIVVSDDGASASTTGTITNVPFFSPPDVTCGPASSNVNGAGPLSLMDSALSGAVPFSEFFQFTISGTVSDSAISGSMSYNQPPSSPLYNPNYIYDVTGSFTRRPARRQFDREGLEGAPEE